MYVHEHPEWWKFRYDTDRIVPILSEVRFRQGKLLGILDNAPENIRREAYVNTLCEDVYCTAKFSGVEFDKEKIRKSVLTALGRKNRDITGIPVDNQLDGQVQVVIDSSLNCYRRFNERRLFAWFSDLFPNGYSGLIKMEAGKYRKNGMQAAFGEPGKEKIYYEAPAPERVPEEMRHFFNWFESNASQPMDNMLRAAIAFFWILTIHPFDDGNGRLAKSIADLLLSRSNGDSMRFFSPNITVMDERDTFYGCLETAQNGNGDLTEWIISFLRCVNRSIERPEIQAILDRNAFWSSNSQRTLNERQILALNKMLESTVETPLTTSEYATLCNCSQDTALRDIRSLMKNKLLRQTGGGGRSTAYFLKQ